MDGKTIANMFNGNKRFVVPVYQRGYSWSTKQVDQFLVDLDEASDENVEEHFFGYILTTPTRHPAIQIVDGQQRITTAMLFLICARNIYRIYEKDELVNAIQKHIYITKNGVDPDPDDPILTLGKANKELFLDILNAEPNEDELKSKLTKRNESNMLLGKAYKTIQKWFNDEERVLISEEDKQNFIKKIRGFEHTLLTKFMIIEQKCDDEKEAYRVFDLVNNRGMRLKDSDLIKNHLFGRMTSGKSGDGESKVIDRYDGKWDEIRKNVTSSETDYDLDKFFSHYLGAIKELELVSSKKIYDHFDNLVKTVDEAKRMIELLLYWSEILYNIRNPGANKEFRTYVDLVHYLTKIKELKATFVYTPIFAGYDKYWIKKKYTSFEALVAVCFKTHVRLKDVLGERDSVVKSVMQEITESINKDKSVKQIVDQIVKHKKYYSEEYVRNALEKEPVTSRNVAVALLEEAEYTRSGNRSSGDVTLEHIMPQTITGNAGKKWTDYIKKHNKIDKNKPDADERVKEVHKRCLQMLGNQTLLTKSENPLASNCIFEEKLEVYKKSKYEITEGVNGEEPWNEDSIKKRQKELARDIAKELELENIKL